ncbi:NADPH-dependent F420 reductase [Microbacterium sp. 22303]|uniref:NADPH-dependent F420 reductase n=1 Tax=Microbacterium sp. 22303 TaxID=3453905 RepID=UPI003F844C6E
MVAVTVIGPGSIGSAVVAVAVRGGADVQVLGRTEAKARAAAEPLGASFGAVGDTLTGDIVVLAVPFDAVEEILGQYHAAFRGRVLVDVSNPVDFATFDGLIVPAYSSAAQAMQSTVPEARVLKAFNTNFAATLHSGVIADQPTAVLVAGDDADAKEALLGVVRTAGLRGVDAGSLKRARELEAIGFLQLTLGMREEISWTGGLGLVA